jgi:hypothetical protein
MIIATCDVVLLSSARGAAGDPTTREILGQRDLVAAGAIDPRVRTDIRWPRGAVLRRADMTGYFPIRP